MKGKCILSKDVPVSIELNDKEYRLAGLVKGDGVHAWAITLKDDKFWEWNNGSVKEIKECDTEKVLLAIYTLISVPSKILDSFESSHKKSFLEKEEFDAHESVYSS
jgi:hypothetical protein